MRWMEFNLKNEILIMNDYKEDYSSRCYSESNQRISE